MNEPTYPKKVLAHGEIVQLNPMTCESAAFAGCLMVVTEVHNWGAQGYVQTLGAGETRGGQAYYRAKWSEMDITFGHAPFVAREELQEWEPKQA